MDAAMYKAAATVGDVAPADINILDEHESYDQVDLAGLLARTAA